jgi:hypothetical protein
MFFKDEDDSLEQNKLTT